MVELILAMTIWGTLGVFVLWSQLPAIEITFYRCLIGTLIIGCGLLKSNKKIEFNFSLAWISLAGIFLVLNWVFLFKSFQISTITIGNISYYLQPIMLMLFGVVFYKEKINFKQISFIFLALCGVLLTINIYNLQSPHIIYGALLALTAALFYTFLTLLMKHVHTHFYIVIFIQLIMGILILFPFVQFHFLSKIALSCLICIGLVHTLLAYFFYYRAITKSNFTEIAVISYLDPIVAILSDVIFFHRQLSILQIVGIFLTFFAIFWLWKSSLSNSQVNLSFSNQTTSQ